MQRQLELVTAEPGHPTPGPGGTGGRGADLGQISKNFLILQFLMYSHKQGLAYEYVTHSQQLLSSLPLSLPPVPLPSLSHTHIHDEPTYKKKMGLRNQSVSLQNDLHGMMQPCLQSAMAMSPVGLDQRPGLIQGVKFNIPRCMRRYTFDSDDKRNKGLCSSTIENSVLLLTLVSFSSMLLTIRMLTETVALLSMWAGLLSGG